MFSKKAKEESGWGLIIIGLVMLLYVLGAMATGSLGVAVFLGALTAAVSPVSGPAAVALWTGVYIALMFIILGWGIFTEFYS